MMRGRDSIEVVVVVPSIVSAVVVLRIGVVGFWGAAIAQVMFVLASTGMLGLFVPLLLRLFLLSWTHEKGCREIG